MEFAVMVVAIAAGTVVILAALHIDHNEFLVRRRNKGGNDDRAA